MTTETLPWRVEESCLSAWPAAETHLFDGWRLRRSGGGTKRTNSANPTLGASEGSHIITEAERFFHAHGQPCIFRIPSMADALDGELEEAGYRRESETLTLLANDIAVPEGRYPVTLAANPAPN